MGFGQSISHVFRNYVNFSGRASRSEFWWWVLFNFIISLILNIIDNIIGLHIGGSTQEIVFNNQVIPLVNQGVGVLSFLWFLAVVLPSLAVAVRRLHDGDHSGWWLLWGGLLSIVCCIGSVILFVFYVTGSKPANRWGEGPARA